MDAIEYDDANRMRYNPRFHPNHGKQFTEEELENPVEQIAYAKAQTPAEAICKAALLAVMDNETN